MGLAPIVFLVAGGTQLWCPPPAPILRMIRGAQHVRMMRLGGREGRDPNPLERSSSGFLGFEIRQGVELDQEGARAMAGALGIGAAYDCERKGPVSNSEIAPLQIGFEFEAKGRRVQAVLFEPEQELEIELDNGVGARVGLSDAGQGLWWEALRPILGPEASLLGFYDEMRASEDSVPARVDIHDPAAETNLELPLEALVRVPPEYPDLARQAGVDGTVFVRALVGPDGAVHRAEIVRGVPMLNEAARRALLQWRFKPAERDGRKVWAWTTHPVRFSLN